LSALELISLQIILFVSWLILNAYLDVELIECAKQLSENLSSYYTNNFYSIENLHGSGVAETTATNYIFLVTVQEQTTIQKIRRENKI
jgi:hypothetical protein